MNVQNRLLHTYIFIPPSPFVNNFLGKGLILLTRILTEINMIYYADLPYEMLTS